ncbi:MAG: HDIG domain-containing protein [Desulfobacterales bacterium]
MKLERNKDAVRKALETSNFIRFAMLLLITVIFTIILYPDLVMQATHYSLGDVAEKDIKSPIDYFIEDRDATLEKRKAAEDQVLTVYDYNSSLASKLTGRVSDAFEHLRKMISAGEPPAESPLLENPKQPGSGLYSEQITEGDRAPKAIFEEKLGMSISEGAFTILEKEGFSADISQLINRILIEILHNGVVTNKELLLNEYDKGIILRDIESQTERVETGLKSFYGLDQAKAMVRIIGQPLLRNVGYTVRNLIVDFAQRFIQPNITLNINETELRKNNAVSRIRPIMYKIKSGEMLLREGERVTEFQLLKLRALQDTLRNKNLFKNSIGGASIILSVLLIIYVLYVNIEKDSALRNNKNLFFLSCMLIMFFVFAKFSATFMDTMIHDTTLSIPANITIFGIPAAAGAMVVCIFMGLNLAVAFSLVLSLSMAALFQNGFVVFLYHFLNSIMAAYWIQDCRERKAFIKAGLKLGVLNILLVTVFSIYADETSGYRLPWSYAFAFLGGIGSGIIVSGLAPLIEIAFGYSTNITLLELANLERPILKRLMLEAPGTYHHSVIVGSMVEAAASAIGANPLLAKVCGYYHDIGKIKKPLYFIENQSNGPNRHNKLAPSMSSLILISHVKEGVEIAKKHKLGHSIIETIKQHHGTSLITYFYEKAKQMKGKDAVKIDDFRYPGPKPQTVEAGLVMLADVVEASARTLENPTPSRIQGHVQNLINKVFSDGQLDACELTLKDLHNIAKSFNKILNGIYHHRVEYSEKSLLSNGKAVNGSTDRQQAKKIQSADKDTKVENAGRLKRLGLS